MPMAVNPWKLWDDVDLFLVAGCGELHNEKLVMREGLGFQAAKQWPSLPGTLGQEIKAKFAMQHGVYTYGLLLPDWRSGKKFGLLQTKTWWALPVDPLIVEYSLILLDDLCYKYPNVRIFADLPIEPLQDYTPPPQVINFKERVR